MPIDRLWIRMAVRLQRILDARARQEAEKTLRQFAQATRMCDQRLAKLSRDIREGWPLSAAWLRRALQPPAQGAPGAVSQNAPLLAAGIQAPDLRTMLDELTQLAQEFGRVEVDCRRHVLTVRTVPIVLEKLCLGRFAIQLNIERLTQQANSLSFFIGALDPRPADSDEEVIHPHVSGNTLCAGEAKVPIQRALVEGRLADAFCLVRSVLSTYNPNNAYVSLEDWHDRECYDCGCPAARDELCYCPVCFCDYCSECMDHCAGCEVCRCQQCLKPCLDCQERFCPGCLVRPDRTVPGRCHACLKQEAAASQAASQAAASPHDPTPVPTPVPTGPDTPIPEESHVPASAGH